MRRIGAHVSIDGGFVNAASEASRLGCDCAQLTVGPVDEWHVEDVDGSDGRRFQSVSTANGVDEWIVAGKPLVDLATPDRDRVRRSLVTIRRELEVARRLDADYYVLSPGTHAGTDARTGLENAARNLSEVDVPGGVTVLLENAPGDGTSVGHRFEELGRILDASTLDEVGLCLDTCNAFAAGYDLTTRTGVARMLDEVETTVGIENLSLVHLNDAEHELGAKRGVPKPVGRGQIGRSTLERVATHDWLRDVPVILESEAESRIQEEIERLRSLAATR